MGEVTQITFTYKEVVEALVKKHDLHSGIWGIYIKFAIKATNLGATESDLLPTAIVPVVEIGLQAFETETNLSVNAATVNPKTKKSPKKAASKKH